MMGQLKVVWKAEMTVESLVDYLESQMAEKLVASMVVWKEQMWVVQ